MKIISKASLLNIDNIDTDRIVPARFLKISTRDGFGKYLFHDLRFTFGGELTDFLLNRQKDRSILVAGKNFGSGSSREHAAWALLDFGFKAVIAPSFSDIFKNNALNNGLLPIALEPSIHEKLVSRIEAGDPELKINVEHNELSVEGMAPMAFDLDPFRKHCLVEGLDPVDYLVSIKEKIEAHEAHCCIAR